MKKVLVSYNVRHFSASNNTIAAMMPSSLQQRNGNVQFIVVSHNAITLLHQSLLDASAACVTMYSVHLPTTTSLIAQLLEIKYCL